jgi:hypothetical protein
MSITYDPKKMLNRIAPERKVEKLLKGNVTLKKTALSFVDDIPFIDKKAVTRVAAQTIKGYKKRVAADKDIKGEILDDPKQLIQRVQNEVVFQVATEIKTQYEGEQYVWLPSDADEPDPEHQLNYGKTFTVGDGEMPGERYGCRCGMEILVKQTELELE